MEKFKAKLFTRFPLIRLYFTKMLKFIRKFLKSFGYLHMDDLLLMSSSGVITVREDLQQQINKLPKEQVNYRDSKGFIRIMKVAPNRKQYMDIVLKNSISIYENLDL